MKPRAEERLNTIRQLIRQERQRIVEQRSKVSEDLGLLLNRALEQLDFLERFFLDPSILAEERSDAEWDRWLGGAESALGNIIALRSYVNQMISKYGPDAKFAG